MKKLLLFVAVVTAFSFASCKKDRVCSCTQTKSDGSPAVTGTITYTKATKSDAKKACVNTTTTDAGVTTTLTCTLK